MWEKNLEDFLWEMFLSVHSAGAANLQFAPQQTKYNYRLLKRRKEEVFVSSY